LFITDFVFQMLD